MRTTLSGNETHGEKKLYYILRDKFNDDYQVWHNVLIHSVSTEIDFVIIHPSEGIYVIEVKDIILDNILSFNQDRIDYQGHNGIQNILNILWIMNGNYQLCNSVDLMIISQFF